MGIVATGPWMPQYTPINPLSLTKLLNALKPLMPKTYYLVLIVSNGCPTKLIARPANDPFKHSLFNWLKKLSSKIDITIKYSLNLNW